MALPSSGQISLGDIAGEIQLVISNISLQSASTLNLLNLNSANRPDGFEPHAISEFLGYDHTASSGLKNMMGSENFGTKVDYRSPELCREGMLLNYWHSGSFDTPAVGDFVYTEDNDKSNAAAGTYVLGAPLISSLRWSMGVSLDSNGRVQSSQLCETGKEPIGGENPIEFDPNNPIVVPIDDEGIGKKEIPDEGLINGDLPGLDDPSLGKK